MNDRVRWGILGPGGIARSFAKGLGAVPDADLVAVGSRSEDRARELAEAFEVPRHYGSYDALVADPEVDVIYIATIHPAHKENLLLAIEAGKAVLCEKPFTMNAAEAKEVIAAARAKGVFVMEGMWTHFLPAIRKVREWIADGGIGDVRMLVADFGYRTGWDPDNDRAVNPDLGGGALLDVGCYPIHFAWKVFGGPPAEVTSAAHVGETGVDEQSATVFSYSDGGLAILSSAVRTRTNAEAWIFGTEGRIHVPSPFYCGTRAVRYPRKGEPEKFEQLHRANGFEYEAEEVMRCLRQGVIESELMPLDETLAILQTMDGLRESWGVSYAADRATVGTAPNL